MQTIKKLKLIKNWTYDPGDKYSLTDDGRFALAKINVKLGECTSRITNDEQMANKYGTFFRCREEFHNVWQDKMQSLLYCHNDGLTNNIADFIDKIENLLKIKNKSKIFSTDRGTISAIKVSPWWSDQSEDCHMKRQVFSLLLRWGRNHKIGNNVFETILNEKYGKEMMNFMRLFISGYTVFSDESLAISKEEMHSGIVFQFSHKSEEEIKQNLFMP
jgi:hypothetical protein